MNEKHALAWPIVQHKRKLQRCHPYLLKKQYSRRKQLIPAAYVELGYSYYMTGRNDGNKAMQKALSLNPIMKIPSYYLGIDIHQPKK